VGADGISSACRIDGSRVRWNGEGHAVTYVQSSEAFDVRRVERADHELLS
jgi:hypothetical protein